MNKVIEQKLKRNLNINYLEIIDNSHLHHGHLGEEYPKVGTHLDVLIVAEDFIGLNKIERQRKIYEILKSELATQLHALSIKTYTAEEFEVINGR